MTVSGVDSRVRGNDEGGCGNDSKRQHSLVWLALIVVGALAVRAAWVVVFQTPPFEDAEAYDELGWRLARGQGYVTADGTPTAFWPVGYPAFLAAIYAVFGHSWVAAGMANALLGAVNAALTYRLAREALSVRVSLVAAGVVALLPSHIITFTAELRTEALHAPLTLAALIAVCRLARRPTWTNAALFGLVVGVGVYVRPILILFPVAVMLLIVIRGAGMRKAVWADCCLRSSYAADADAVDCPKLLRHGRVCICLHQRRTQSVSGEWAGRYWGVPLGYRRHIFRPF